MCDRACNRVHNTFCVPFIEEYSTLYIVHCISRNTARVQCTLYTVFHEILHVYNVHCTLYFTKYCTCTMYIVHYISRNAVRVQCTLYRVHYTVYTVHSIQYTLCTIVYSPGVSNMRP